VWKWVFFFISTNRISPDSVPKIAKSQVYNDLVPRMLLSHIGSCESIKKETAVTLRIVGMFFQSSIIEKKYVSNNFS
jgi:hypothetical protein